MEELFLITVILTASLIVWVRHWILLIAQIAFGILVYQFIPDSIMGAMLLLQVLFSIWIFLRVCYAAHYQYQLENEKTHRLPQHFTTGGRSGRRKNFFLL